jgi:DNA phosphorothioation-associated putative methyltransferase
MCAGGIVNEEAAEIRREKTAIFRDRLSTPMQMLLKHQYLDGDHSIFDYGCGRGDDLRALESQGISATGWDPHYAPDNPKSVADIVNLGFVINVIEHANERAEALKSAFKLAKRLLVVTVMLDSQAQYRTVQRHADGIVTSTKTFQKYYSQTEIRLYVEHQLGRQPIVVAPGCLFVFRSDENEQDFLAQRHSHRIAPDELVRWSLPADKNLRIYERNKDLLEAFWKSCLNLGRLPANDEFTKSDELKEKIGSPKKAISILSSDQRSNALKLAAQRRASDLCVFFALNLL